MPLDFTINPVSLRLKPELQAKIDQKTKPLGALGQLETLALKIGLIQNTLTPSLTKPTILIFAGDHGIVESGVSAYPQTVTAQMVANFLAGGAAISVFARQHQLGLFVVDAGVNASIPHPNPLGNCSRRYPTSCIHAVVPEGEGAYSGSPQLIDAKIARGTKNFLNDSAMSANQCIQAIQTGAGLVLQQHENGCNCVGFGEMGIGNTSSAALLTHCLSDIPLAQCVGRGTGLDDSQLQNKHTVLQQALTRHQGISEPLDVLATFGGFEIAMMVGAYLKAAELGILVMVDGFIASAALLVAYKLKPQVLDYCVFSHVSSEQGHPALLVHLNVQPLLNLELRLGEGSGIAVAYPLIQSAVLFLNEMATFADAGVDQQT